MRNQYLDNRVLNNLYQMRNQSYQLIEALEMFLVRFGNPFDEKKGIVERIKFQLDFLKALEYEMFRGQSHELLYRNSPVSWLDKEVLFKCVSVSEAKELIIKSDSKQKQQCLKLMQQTKEDVKVHLLLIEYLDFLVSLNSTAEVMYSTTDLPLDKFDNKLMV